MNLYLPHIPNSFQGEITITGSKSESNRLLLLQQLYPELIVENISNSDDSVLMQKALQSSENVIDIHHAGTAMRFLTAYFSIVERKEIVLTGSSRMKERPIQILVEALQQLGANISYAEKEGFPPLKIKGTAITKNKVSLKADVSSQYISALLLIAPKLKNGLELTLKGKITSRPYIEMTLNLLNDIGVETSFENQVIKVASKPKIQNLKLKTHIVEADWSAASYYYSLVALQKDSQVTLHNFKKDSLQGDSCLATIYKNLNVETTYNDNSITLKHISLQDANLKPLTLNLKDAPDIAQTIAVTCLGLNVSCQLTGLHTLKIKETDRLQALKNEIEKFGATVKITDDSLQLTPSKKWHQDVLIQTYNDHRMAMAFAPLCLKTALKIEDYMVVSKSYPQFWQHLESLLNVQFKK